MGELQLSLLDGEYCQKPEVQAHIEPIKQKKERNKSKEPYMISLFKSNGIRHDGIMKLGEKFHCIRCERLLNPYPRCFCQDCKSSGAYRFSECY